MKRLYYFGADCPEMREWIAALRTPEVAEFCDVLLQEAKKNKEAASEYIWAVNEILKMENNRLHQDNAPRLSFWNIQEWFERCFNTVVLMRGWAIDNHMLTGIDRAEAERQQSLKEAHQQKILAYVKGNKLAFKQ